MLRIARDVCWTLSVPFFAACARPLEKSAGASHRITQKHRDSHAKNRIGENAFARE
jgi:hypothetical protein